MLDLINISLQFGGKYLFKDVNLKINSGDKISLVGPNGTGKSSLLKIINGELQPESGKISIQKRTSIGHLPQENVTHSGSILLDEAKSALTDIVELQGKEKELTDRLSDPEIDDETRHDFVNQLGEVHYRLEELDSYSAESKVEKILIGLGFEEKDFPRLTDEFSGGWQMRIALAKILIKQNDILLLDEPTNHLDLDSLEWLIGFLKSYKGALVIVSHDKHFINQVTNRTLEIYLGRFNTYNGNYDDYLRFKDERDKQAENLFVIQQKKIRETERFIERFRYKATKARQVQSRIKQLEKMELIELPESTDEIYIRFPEPPSSGRINVELKDITKSYGDNVVLKDLSFVVNRGEKIAFVGPNGAGKTTLSKIIAGVLDYDSGERKTGHNTIISYYAQDVADNLDPDLDIIETIDGIAEDKTIGQLRALLGSFLFTGDDVFKKTEILSGGEKSRVALAKILLTKANFIILDEPTNHLDISSKKVLQRALIDFKGSLILVSHDIDFLTPVVNKVVEIRKGRIKTYEGGIEYYLRKRELVHEEIEKEETVQVSEAITRKDQKRIEAELRQRKYNATKDLMIKVQILEKKIAELEKKEKELERDLALPGTYTNPETARGKNLEFRNIKAELEQTIDEWGKISDELNRIEQQFT